MKSVRLQLLVTLLAVGTVVGIVAAKGLPPTKNLFKATYDDDLGAIHRSLRWGVDVNQKGWMGWTPLHTAATLGRKDVAELFIAHGAKVNAKDVRGRTPLYDAACHNNKDLAELLIAHGAEVNAKNNLGQTPLHDAASYGRKEVAELLIARGAEVNAKSSYGRTPLHSAACTRDFPELRVTDEDIKNVAELLIVRGAEVNAKDNDGLTPLRLAIDNRHDEIADLLRRHGARQ